jgi:hypothetical protein
MVKMAKFVKDIPTQTNRNSKKDAWASFFYVKLLLLKVFFKGGRYAKDPR